MTDSFSPIGIYGGTFDPIHYGHLRPVLEVKEHCLLQHIRFIPVGNPVHREQPVLSITERLELVKAAIEKQEDFILDCREIERGGDSYMLHTLQSLKEEFPTRTLCLILGMDAYLSFDKWYQWQNILDYCHLIITRRPGCTAAHLPQTLQLWQSERVIQHFSVLHQSLYGKIYFQPVNQLDISSSFIRESIQEQRSIRFLLPEKVLQLIEQQHYYQTTKL